METHDQKSIKSTRFSLSEFIRLAAIALSRCLCIPILAYQYLISPWLAKSCRFEPSCSHYALQSLRQHGPIKGSSLSLIRLCKCHPWHQGGYDPVPTNKKSQL